MIKVCSNIIETISSADSKHTIILFINKGFIVLDIDGIRYYLGGQSLIIFSGDIIKMIFCSTDINTISISINSHFLQDTLITIYNQSFIFNKCILILNSSYFLYFKSVLNDINIEDLNSNKDIEKVRNIILDIEYKIRNISLKKDKYIIDSLLEYINNNILNDISINELCSVFNSNKTTLCKIFKEYTHQTIKDYIISQKIMFSKELLSNTDLSIQEICDRFKFYDSSYFTKIFKKKVGETPLNFKKHKRLQRNTFEGV